MFGLSVTGEGPPMIWRRGTLTVVLIGLLAGCSTLRVSTPAECLDVPAPQYEQYENLLARVMHDGQVDFQTLKANPADLERFVHRLGCHGPIKTPDAFPDDASKLAYWVNAHNAVALLAAVRKYPAKSLKPPFGDFAQTTTAWIDGRHLSLAQIAQFARSARPDDPRVDLALAYPTKGGGSRFGFVLKPREDLVQQLHSLFVRSLDDSAAINIDHARWTLWLGRPIWDNRDRYLAQYRDQYGTAAGNIVNALADLANPSQRRRLNTAIGYKIKPQSYDWSLNASEPYKCSLSESTEVVR